LTKQLLAFSSQSPKASTTVDLHRIIKETVTLFKRTLNKQITLEVNLDADSSTIVGDPSLLHNTLLNLCINAAQAMPAGGLLHVNTREVTLDEHFCTASAFELNPGRYIETEVRDNGCGIAQEHLGRIFEPFFTTKEQGEGTGLGLSSVYGTVQRHGGSISVYSEEGQGSTFQILLPLAGNTTIGERPEGEIKRGSGCVLVVDDEEIMRSTAKAILEALGYEVMLAENGQVALDLFSRQQGGIDLVLLDMIMPVMNGRECFERLKKHDPQVKVILSSGFSREDDLQEMTKAGLRGFIRKPYLTSGLSQIVHEVLVEKG
jgi:CheY-like chemotaxis protein